MCFDTCLFVFVVEMCGCTHMLIVFGVVDARYYVWIMCGVCVFEYLCVHVVCEDIGCRFKHVLILFVFGSCGFSISRVDSVWVKCGVCVLSSCVCIDLGDLGLRTLRLWIQARADFVCVGCCEVSILQIVCWNMMCVCLMLVRVDVVLVNL